MRIVLIAAAAAAVLLAACGNNDNGSSDAVSLSSTSDVQREYSNLITGFVATVELPVAAAGDARPESSSPTVTTAHLQKLLAGRALSRAAIPQAAVPNAAAPHADAATTCNVSGTDTATTGQSKSRTFTLFPGTTEAVNYSTDAFSSCTITGGVTSSGTTSVTGAYELGSTSDESAAYYLFGSGTTSLQIAITESASSSSSSSSSSGGSSSGSSSGSSVVNILALGTIEELTNSSSSSSSSGGSEATSEQVRVLTALSGSTGSFKVEIDLGTTENPLSLVATNEDSTTTWDFTGPYRYTGTASGCGGGVVNVTTGTPLVTSSEFGSFTGGMLTFSSGSDKATLTFNSDGSATISGSASGTLSAADIQGALNAPTCLGGLIPSDS